MKLDAPYYYAITYNNLMKIIFEKWEKWKMIQKKIFFWRLFASVFVILCIFIEYWIIKNDRRTLTKKSAMLRIRPITALGPYDRFETSPGQNIPGRAATERIIRVWLALFTAG